MDEDNVALAFLHPHLLLAERAEKVFHQAPVEKRAVLVDPCDFKIGEIAHLGVWPLGSGHKPLLVVEIDKDLKLVAHLAAFRHIACRQEDFAFVASVKIHSEVDRLDHGHPIIVTQSYEIHTSFCFNVIMKLPACYGMSLAGLCRGGFAS